AGRKSPASWRSWKPSDHLYSGPNADRQHVGVALSHLNCAGGSWTRSGRRLQPTRWEKRRDMLLAAGAAGGFGFSGRRTRKLSVNLADTSKPSRGRKNATITITPGLCVILRAT